MTSALNGRVSRLEATMPPTLDHDACQRCGLPHVRLPVPLELGTAVVRFGLGSSTARPPLLCLCLDCCADGHAIARLTHGLPPERGAA